MKGVGFSVWGAGCWVEGSRFRVQGVASGFRVQGVVPDDQCHAAFGVVVEGSGFGVQGSGFRVQGSGLKV